MSSKTEIRKNNEKPAPLVIWKQIQSLINTINHIFIGLIAIYITALARSLQFKDTAMHVFMTVIGFRFIGLTTSSDKISNEFHVLAAEALMSHYPINPITNRLSHRNKSRIHGLLQLAGGSMALLGALGKISSTEIHFTTWHGKIGLAATFMCFASLLGGIVNFFQPKFAHKLYSPSEIKFRHNLFGMVTFTLAMGTILLGYQTKFFLRHVDAEFIPAIGLATILVYIFTMIAPASSLLDKLKYRRTKKN